MQNLTLTATLATVLLFLCDSRPGMAQHCRYTYVPYGSHYSWYIPGTYVDTISSRVHAQADLVRSISDARRSYGDTAVSYATASRINVDTMREQLWLPFERQSAIWAARRQARQQTELFRHDPIKDMKRTNSRNADQMLNHADASPGQIISGYYLNELLGRLSTSILAEDFAAGYARIDTDEPSILSSELLSHLRIRRASGQSVVFSASEGLPLRLDPIPYALKDPQFRTALDNVRMLRDTVFEESRTGDAGYDSLRLLKESLEELHASIKETPFKNRYDNLDEPRALWTQAEKFVLRLKQEVRRIQDCGRVLPYDGAEIMPDPGADQDVVSFLKRMCDSGLKFDRARPGDESAYHELFQQMQALYSRVAPDDAGAADDPAYRNPDFSD